MRSSYPICLAAAWLAVVTAGCGSSDRRPSLPITSDNASLIATLITVAGDELSVPNTGEDFIKLEVDPGTGTLDAPRWLSWAALSAAM